MAAGKTGNPGSIVSSRDFAAISALGHPRVAQAWPKLLVSSNRHALGVVLTSPLGSEPLDVFYVGECDAYMRYLDLPGTDPAVVFIPGAALSGTANFIPTAVESGLSNRRRIIVDLLGGGYSDSPSDFDYSMEGHAGTIASLLDDLGLKRCGVVGHSLGGAVAIALAAKRPDLVGCLMLAEANLDPVGGAFTQFVTSYSEEDFVAQGHSDLLGNLRDQAQKGDGLSAFGLGIIDAADPRAIHRSAVGVTTGMKPIMRDLLIGMTVPRLYVFGERSLPDEDYQRLPQSGIEVAVVPEAGHVMTVDNPAGFARVLESFLLSCLQQPNPAE